MMTKTIISYSGETVKRLEPGTLPIKKLKETTELDFLLKQSLLDVFEEQMCGCQRITSGRYCGGYHIHLP